MKGYLNQNWHRVLCSKIIGGTLCILGGLSLGREGPSVQLGAMAAKGIAKITKISNQRTLYDDFVVQVPVLPLPLMHRLQV